jgi:hypothetical protein
MIFKTTKTREEAEAALRRQQIRFPNKIPCLVQELRHFPRLPNTPREFVVWSEKKLMTRAELHLKGDGPVPGNNEICYLWELKHLVDVVVELSWHVDEDLLEELSWDEVYPLGS